MFGDLRDEEEGASALRPVVGGARWGSFLSKALPQESSLHSGPLPRFPFPLLTNSSSSMPQYCLFPSSLRRFACASCGPHDRRVLGVAANKQPHSREFPFCAPARVCACVCGSVSVLVCSRRMSQVSHDTRASQKVKAEKAVVDDDAPSDSTEPAGRWDALEAGSRAIHGPRGISRRAPQEGSSLEDQEDNRGPRPVMCRLGSCLLHRHGTSFGTGTKVARGRGVSGVRRGSPSGVAGEASGPGL